MLPEFTDGRALPAAAGFGTAFGTGTGWGEVLPDMGGERGAGTVEVEAAGQFVGQESEVQRLAVGQDVRQEGVGGGGPVGAMLAAGGLEGEGVLVAQPLMAQFVAAGAADRQAFGSGGRVGLAGGEGGQDFLHKEGRQAMGQLFFSCFARSRSRWGRCPPTPEVHRFGTLVERSSAANQKRLQKGLKPLAEPLKPRGCRRRSGCASAEPCPAPERAD